MSKPKIQKEAIFRILENIFGTGSVQKEVSYNWMASPGKMDDAGEYTNIIQSLVNYRNKIEFVKTHKPNCDFVIESKKIIVEYDERQHFSEARKIALEAYPSNVMLFFDKEKWIEYCEKINAKDNDPHFRDEQRAFYDSVRDIASDKNGYNLYRIKDNEFDWTSKDAESKMRYLLSIREEK